MFYGQNDPLTMGGGYSMLCYGGLIAIYLKKKYCACISVRLLRR